jgi:hypothetical protein
MSAERSLEEVSLQSSKTQPAHLGTAKSPIAWEAAKKAREMITDVRDRGEKIDGHIEPCGDINSDMKKIALVVSG